jgi:hypothetical protein
MESEDVVWAGGGRVILVADASESAAQYWSETVRTLEGMITALSREAPCDLYVLGWKTPSPIDALVTREAGFPYRQARFCSLIAPIMETIVQRHQRVEALIIVGNGKIWDLGDWTDCPLVARWLLLRSGQDSLDTGDLPEYPADHWKEALARLRSGVGASPARRAMPVSFWSSTSYTWEVDRAGFPLVYVEAVDAFVHLFPVAKAQFERFLWQHNPQEWGDTRYAELLAHNPRASPSGIRTQPYERLFLTGIVPDEVNTFAGWLGVEFDLLDNDEWRAVCHWLEHQLVTAAPPELSKLGLSSIAQGLWQAILTRLKPETLLELSLMVNGVIEWTIERSGCQAAPQYVGMGLPRHDFFPTSKGVDEPQYPIDSAQRMRHFGFRLKRR